MNEKLESMWSKAKALAESTRGKYLFQYLLCVVAAFVFWLFISLDGEVQKDYEVPLRIVNIPDGVVNLDHWPANVAVTVQGKGLQFIGCSWGEMSPLKVSFTDFVDDKGVFRMSKTKIESKIHDYFGQNVSVLNTRPDSIVVHTTSSPGRRVRLTIDADVSSSYQSVISGPIVANVDSVTLYSSDRLPASITYVSTEAIKDAGLTDTTYYQSVRIVPIPGVLIVPETVDVTVPVEPLIAKKKTVPIQVVNQPENRRVMLFPYSVDVSYLVPMSKYGADMQLSAYVNYGDIALDSNKVKVYVTADNPLCHNISYSPTEAEYVLEFIGANQ